MLNSSTIVLRELHVGAYNPRKVINALEYNDFKQSILAQGVLQPILARPVKGKKTPFEVVAGQRRFLAALEVFGQDYEIPVLLKEMDDAQAEAAAAAENIDRAQMSPAEESECAAKLLARCNGDKQETAKKMGWTLTNLNNRLKLMACSELVRKSLSHQKISLGLAELLAGLTTVKQDALILEWHEKMPSIEEAKAIIMAATKALETAIFDKTECAQCPHNSGQQKSLFGNMQEGHCLNAACFDGKTEEKLEMTKESLKEEYQRIEIVRPGDNFRLSILKAEEVGDEQAQACKSCKNYGAAVSALPNKLGKVSKGLCYDTDCKATKMKEFAAANAVEEVDAEEEGDSPAKAEAGGDEPKAAPATKAVKPSATAAIGNATLEYRDALYAKIIQKEIATNDKLAGKFLVALLLSGKASSIDAAELRQSVEKGKLVEKTSVTRVVDNMSLLKDADEQRIGKLLPLIGSFAIKALSKDEKKGLIQFANVNWANYFDLSTETGKKLLATMTKAEISSLCEEMGIKAAMGKTYAAMMQQKKDEIIQSVTKVANFDYHGKVPKILNPEFEK